MLRLLKRLLTVIGLAAILWFGAHWYAIHRISSALHAGGMSEKQSFCVARRMVKRLSFIQLRKLEAFEDEPRSIGGLIRAARRIDDSEVLLVTTSSAALCTIGLAK